VAVMGGRNAKPISLHIAEGNPNRLTKAEIEIRKQTEIKIGSATLRSPTFIRNNTLAYAKWKEILKIYKNADFVSSGDVGLLARYCMTHSEYIELLKRRKRINNISEDSDDVLDYIESSGEFNDRIKNQLSDMVSTDYILKLDTAVNKKMDMLIKMEDRLFLNPLAKVKNIPKAPIAKKVNKFDKFNNG